MAVQRLRDLDKWKLADSDKDIRGWRMVDADGNTLGTVSDLIVNTDRKEVQTVVLDNGREIPVRDIHIGDRVVQLGTAHGDVAARTTGGLMEESMRTIPVVEEDLLVGKRQVERGGVRVESHVEEKPVEEQVQLREERVVVDRRPVNKEVSPDVLDKVHDEVIEVQETAEEPVVSKQARVVEEVNIGKDVDTHTETVRDTVRRTDVDIKKDSDPGRRRR